MCIEGGWVAVLISVEGVEVAGSHTPLLLPTSLEAASGEVTLVAGDPGYGHVALALVLGGRLLPTGGRVALDGDEDPATRQRQLALVDVTGVSAPEDGIPVRAVLAEELALAGQAARRADVDAFLQEHDAGELARRRWEELPADLRTAWLAGIAGRRHGVTALLLANPDRFGGHPRSWWAVARDLAGQGFAVIVQCTHASLRLLGEPVRFELGAAS